VSSHHELITGCSLLGYTVRNTHLPRLLRGLGGELYGSRQMPKSKEQQLPIDPEWTGKDARRSSRVLLNVPVLVEGTRQDGSIFKEETDTLVVSVYGALLLIAETMGMGQEVELTNQQTHAKLAVRVVYVGQTHGGKSRVGVEFLKPEPGFWLINFPLRNRNAS
jgi:PilZ domain-containing protein